MKNKRFIFLIGFLAVTVLLAGAFAACTGSERNEYAEEGESVDYNGGRADDEITSGDYGSDVWYAKSGDFVYEVHEGYATIDKLADYRQEYVTVPSNVELDGRTYSVNRINSRAFADTHAKEIIIEDGVIEIEDYAFDGNSYLQSIVIPDSVKSIGEYAFNNCEILGAIEIPASVAEYGLPLISGCESLSALVLPYMSATLGKVFGNRQSVPQSLAKVTVKGGKSIPDGAFLQAYGIEEIIVTGNVESIGNEAFKACGSLRSVSLAEGITAIGNGAFEGCDSLREIVLPQSLSSIGDRAFAGCAEMESIVLPSDTETVGAEAFEGCDSLFDVTLNENLSCIGESAFDNCASLTSLVLPDSLLSISTIIDEGTSLNSLSVPYIGTTRDEASVLSSIVSSRCLGSIREIIVTDADAIAAGALRNTSIEKAVLNEGIETIGNMAFANCGNLQEINIPKSVTSIGDMAFVYCYSLYGLYIPESVQYLGNMILTSEIVSTVIVTPHAQKPQTWSENCFVSTLPVVWDCENNDLTQDGYKIAEDDECIYLVKDGKASVIRGKNLTADGYKIVPQSVVLDGVGYVVDKIADKAFYHTNLTIIQLPDTVTEIGASAFASCSELVAVVANGVQVIGASAFSACTNLNKIALPQSLTTIGQCAFEYCRALTQIEIPSGVKDVNARVFAECSRLEKVVMSDGVQNIGSQAFANCTALTEVVMSQNLQDIGMSAFEGCTSLTDIVLPDSLQNINGTAFGGCTAIEEIVISYGVNYIAANAFQGCTGLEYVEFADTSSWQAGNIWSTDRIDIDVSDPYYNVNYFLSDEYADYSIFFHI